MAKQMAALSLSLPDILRQAPINMQVYEGEWTRVTHNIQCVKCTTFALQLAFNFKGPRPQARLLLDFSSAEASPVRRGMTREPVQGLGKKGFSV